MSAPTLPSLRVSTKNGHVYRVAVEDGLNAMKVVVVWREGLPEKPNRGTQVQIGVGRPLVLSVKPKDEEEIVIFWTSVVLKIE